MSFLSQTHNNLSMKILINGVALVFLLEDTFSEGKNRSIIVAFDSDLILILLWLVLNELSVLSHTTRGELDLPNEPTHHICRKRRFLGESLASFYCFSRLLVLRHLSRKHAAHTELSSCDRSEVIYLSQEELNSKIFFL